MPAKSLCKWENHRHQEKPQLPHANQTICRDQEINMKGKTQDIRYA